MISFFTSNTDITQLPPLQQDEESENRCRKIEENFVKKGLLPTFLDQDMFFRYLSRKQVNAIVDKNYHLAGQIQERIQLVQNGINEQNKPEDTHIPAIEELIS
jgi:hypothetical protein